MARETPDYASFQPPVKPREIFFAPSASHQLRGLGALIDLNAGAVSGSENAADGDRNG
ncbi:MULTISPECIES: hypothetical protein [unclassified Novosphingobium]|uniref:hypothetical protein n=1 Tax=unclassified Novosphingobium TaxID=2644732 RepID=UPI000AF24CE4|nr:MULTISPECIES: hypothetical protein [unclassified Novosphingobium]WRT95048.1 hypothetical protein U9J33_22855 [Novosphingobium sp. RL4]